MLRRGHTRVLLLLLAVGVPPSLAAERPASPMTAKAFQHPELFIPAVHEAGPRTPLARRQFAAELGALGAAEGTALFDVRAGRWGSLVTRTPVLPGRGNTLRWSDLGAAAPEGRQALREPAWAAVLQVLQRWQGPLRLDLREIGRPRVTVSAGGTLIQIHAPRVVGGIPVRGSELSAVVSHGNLVLLGLNRWGDAAAPPAPAVAAERARLAVADHLRPFAVQTFGAEPRLELIPLARGTHPDSVVEGAGYDYRLAWVVTATVAGDVGTWEGLVDAASGELFALQDTNQYQTARTVVGGVYPTSNDGLGADGVEQPGYPMPYTDVQAEGATVFANAGGGAGCVEGTISTTLNGRYVHIANACGPVNETSASSIDLGTSAGTDCTVPAGHSAGDTPAARTTYYELNRIMEQARGYLPDIEWLRTPLTANVDINNVCNANWNGLTVNFYRRSLGNGCANTGEIASIVDHEFAHGLDNNTANPSISRPAEALGHILAAFRQNDSCIGRGFDTFGFNCNGFGDPCTSCTGIEDVDFARHASGLPHEASFVANCSPAFGSSGPCGKANHCEAMIVGEAAWDLYARDLQNPGTFNYDRHTALEVATRLFYLGGQNVGDWYACTPIPFAISGCSVTGGYLNLLAADDDDGNLSNGTPHMTAIFDAFNRHGIACTTPAPATFGCAGGPVAAPILSAAARDQGAVLTWTAVAGATRYAVFRAEGVKGCSAGKIKVGETSGTNFRDEGLLNGFGYAYTVLPIGATDTCTGRMSACQGIEPTAGPNLAFAGQADLVFGTGDGDVFLDNCEVATAELTLENMGGATLSNVRVLSVAPAGASIQLLDSVPFLVAPALSTCQSAAARFAFVPEGMSFDGPTELVVTFTADEIPEPRTVVLRYEHAESDFAERASRTFSFESDLEGWQVVSGTWSRSSVNGGAGGTSFYARSSQNLDDQCDRIQSPLVRLDPGSTLSLSTRYQIEPPSFPGPEHYDRANVGVVNEAGARTTISPDAGHLYTVPPGALFLGCGQDSQPGWNGTNPASPGFNASAWSAGALNPGGMFTGEPVRLDVAYATDVVTALDGIRFDEVTLTNFAEQAPDAQGDSCLPILYYDGFGDGVLPDWTFTGAWRERSGRLSSPARGTSAAMATDFKGCEVCSLSTSLRTRGARRLRSSDRSAWIFFHWQDADNFVSLELRDHVAFLRRVEGGVERDSAADKFPGPGAGRRRVKISYDGEMYRVFIDGRERLALGRGELAKGGTFGLGSHGATTSFDFVAIE